MCLLIQTTFSVSIGSIYKGRPRIVKDWILHDVLSYISTTQNQIRSIPRKKRISCLSGLRPSSWMISFSFPHCISFLHCPLGKNSPVFDSRIPSANMCGHYVVDMTEIYVHESIIIWNYNSSRLPSTIWHIMFSSSLSDSSSLELNIDWSFQAKTVENPAGTLPKSPRPWIIIATSNTIILTIIVITAIIIIIIIIIACANWWYWTFPKCWNMRMWCFHSLCHSNLRFDFYLPIMIDYVVVIAIEATIVVIVDRSLSVLEYPSVSSRLFPNRLLSRFRNLLVYFGVHTHAIIVAVGIISTSCIITIIFIIVVSLCKSLNLLRNVIDSVLDVILGLFFVCSLLDYVYLRNRLLVCGFINLISTSFW